MWPSVCELILLSTLTVVTYAVPHAPPFDNEGSIIDSMGKEYHGSCSCPVSQDMLREPGAILWLRLLSLPEDTKAKTTKRTFP